MEKENSDRCRCAEHSVTVKREKGNQGMGGVTPRPIAFSQGTTCSLPQAYGRTVQDLRKGKEIDGFGSRRRKKGR